MAALAASWRSIGLRAAELEWELPRPVHLHPPLASMLRSALGPALARAGVSPCTLRSIPGSTRTPGLWFTGWHVPAYPTLRLRAGLRCVGAAATDWHAIERALSQLELPSAGGLCRVLGCSVRWQRANGGGGEGFGPPLVDDPVLLMKGGGVRVEAVTPVQLRERGRELHGAPPLHVLVRSAGERLRQLCQDWSTVTGGLTTTIGHGVREARSARLEWARAERAPALFRTTSGGHPQHIGGVLGTFAYESATPLAVTILAMGAELGIGKDIAFGCGQVRLFEVPGQ